MTWDERWQFEAAVAQRAIEDVDAEPQRSLDVVEHLSQFPPQERATAVTRLKALASKETLSAELRERIWNELDKIVRRHRAFATAERALPAEEVDRMAEVADEFKPRDPIPAHTWLFEHQLPDLGEGRGDYREQQARIEETRSAAVSEILGAHGVEGLLELASKVEFPDAVGPAAALRASGDLDERVNRELCNRPTRAS